MILPFNVCRFAMSCFSPSNQPRPEKHSGKRGGQNRITHTYIHGLVMKSQQRRNKRYQRVSYTSQKGTLLSVSSLANHFEPQKGVFLLTLQTWKQRLQEVKCFVKISRIFNGRAGLLVLASQHLAMMMESHLLSVEGKRCEKND